MLHANVDKPPDSDYKAFNEVLLTKTQTEYNYDCCLIDVSFRKGFLTLTDGQKNPVSCQGTW